jgi:hypothetical protein
VRFVVLGLCFGLSAGAALRSSQGEVVGKAVVKEGGRLSQAGDLLGRNTSVRKILWFGDIFKKTL